MASSISRCETSRASSPLTSPSTLKTGAFDENRSVIETFRSKPQIESRDRCKLRTNTRKSFAVSADGGAPPSS